MGVETGLTGSSYNKFFLKKKPLVFDCDTLIFQPHNLNAKAAIIHIFKSKIDQMTMCTLKSDAPNDEPTDNYYQTAFHLISMERFNVFQLIVLVWPSLFCFTLTAVICVIFGYSKNALKTHCTLTAQHQTVDRHS